MSLTALHMHLSNLISRYGTPLHFIDLLSTRKRDVEKLGDTLEHSLLTLNLPGVEYFHHEAYHVITNKKRQNSFLKDVSKAVSKQGIFSSTLDENGELKEITSKQNGIFRCNGMDEMDGTNYIQFCISKEVVSRMLQTMGGSSTLNRRHERKIAKLWYKNILFSNVYVCKLMNSLGRKTAIL
jgi:hypothetical protein